MTTPHHTAIALLATLAATTLAGPLTPPPGAPSPTNKTLQEVEPRIPISNTGNIQIIDQPGSYYLTEDVFSVVRAIEIRSGQVTLDLNGFPNEGDGIGSTGDIGILVTSSVGNEPVVIRNGFITGFFGDGLATSASLMQLRIDDIHVSDCDYGFDISGAAAITNCTSTNNLNDGYRVTGSATLENCFARSNTQDGFDITDGALRGCNAFGNGINGFLLADNTFTATVIAAECVAQDNGVDGFATQGPVALHGCTSSGNTVAGFDIDFPSALIGCLAVANMNTGFAVGSGSAIHACVSQDNEGIGFTTGGGAAVADCIARNNTGAGFTFGPGASAVGCTATNNTNGFVLSSDCRVSHCSADGNGEIGFQGSSDTTIDSCTSTDHTTGFVAGTGGLIIRCSAAGNVTDYNTANAAFGPIISLGVGGGAVITSNPFANIEH
mgnify:CR=1 FL=1